MIMCKTWKESFTAGETQYGDSTVADLTQITGM